MVDEIVTRQELIDAKRDARDLGKAVNEKVIVSPRYGEDFKSLPMIAEEFQDAIEAAAAAGAGENGWTDLLIQTEDGTTQRVKNTSFQSQIDSKASTAYVDAQDANLQTQINGKASAAYLENALDEQTQTVNTALSQLSTAANKFYPTLAAANLDIGNFEVNQPIQVGEVANGGLWYKATAGSLYLTKSAYDPLNLAKSYSDENKSFNLSIALTDGENFITEAQAKNNVLYFTGTLIADATVIFPKKAAIYLVQNSTSGGFNVNVKTLDQSSTAVQIRPSERVFIFNVGTQIRSTGNLKADLDSPTFTGLPKAPTASALTDDTRVATTAFVQAAMRYGSASTIGISVTDITDDIVITDTQFQRNFFVISGTLTANLNIIFPSTPRKNFSIRNETNGGFALNIKTAGQVSNIIQSRSGSTKYFVNAGNRIYSIGTEKADLDSPTFTGTPTAPTPSVGDKSLKIATTAFVKETQGITTITLDDSINAFTAEDIGRGTIRLSGTLTENKTISFPAAIGAWDVINLTTGGFSISLKALSQTGAYIEIPNGAARSVYVYGGVVRELIVGSSGGYTLPKASASVLGGVKVGGGLTVNADGVLSATGEVSPLALNYRGQFQYDGQYNQGDIVEHGSGIYQITSHVDSAKNPELNAKFSKISHNSKSGANRSIVTKNTSIQSVTGNLCPKWLSDDGMIAFNLENRYLKVSRDYGKTWLSGYFADFGTGLFSWIRQTNDGELLVCWRDTTTSPHTYTLRKTTGFNPITLTGHTWSIVNTLQREGVTYQGSWGFSQHNNIVLLAEYGAKTGVAYTNLPNGAPEGANARYVYMSKDFGKTWSTIFDLNSVTDGVGVHPHGVCFDPYWNRIWVSHGDGAFGSNGLFYSDDFGQTWISATEFHNKGINFNQTVHIVALPTCILFASDSAPNGIHRIDRSQGKAPTKGWYDIDVAYRIPNSANTLNHLCHSVYKAKYLPDSPYIFGFGAEVMLGKNCVVATFDGWTFNELWIDDVNSSIGRGVRTVIGPTYENEVIVICNDEGSSRGSWYQATLKVEAE